MPDAVWWLKLGRKSKATLGAHFLHVSPTKSGEEIQAPVPQCKQVLDSPKIMHFKFDSICIIFRARSDSRSLT